MVLLSQKPLDPRNLPDLNDFLSNLQGNILKGHGREYAAHIFIRFEANKQNKVAKYLRRYAKDKLTSCKAQLHDIERYKEHGGVSPTFHGFYLSADGYRYLGCDLDGFKDAAFIKGMKKASLNDPPAEQWENGFQDEIHACFLVADSHKLTLNRAVQAIIAVLNGQLGYEQDEQKREKSQAQIDKDRLATVLAVEYGNVLLNENKQAIEHFGYVDGISQPLFLKKDVDAYYRANLDPLHFDPAAELALALTIDPFVPPHEEAYGSYLVFRKLEQNVRGFKEAEIALGNQMNLSKEDEERVGAMLIGRFEDGTPIAITDKQKGIIDNKTTNNFNYSNDPKGLRCPVHAHIRKTNPRGGTTDQEHRIVRRGIPYGYQYVMPSQTGNALEQLPQSGVGLLFMCFQSSIVNQFEFIQNHWASNPDFPHQQTGIDPLIGQDGKDDVSLGHFAKDYGKNRTDKFSFEHFVNLKGGEYFFAPSLFFLKKIKATLT